MAKKKIRNPWRNHLLPSHRGVGRRRDSPSSSQQGKEPATVTIAVAIEFPSTSQDDDQGQTEENHPQPGKEDVEKSQPQINGGHDPQVFIPGPLPAVFLHCCTSRSVTRMAEAGHSLAHFPQPTHFSPFTWAMTPFQMEMAPKGHTSRQLPQATQSCLPGPIFSCHTFPSANN